MRNPQFYVSGKKPMLLIILAANHHFPGQEIYKIMIGLSWITIFGHEWGDLPTIFTSDAVTRENHWRIASPVTKTSLFTLCHTVFNFLHALLYPGHSNPLKSLSNYRSPLSPRTVLPNLAWLWRHHNWSVRSRKCEVLVLWHHIRRLFLLVEIGTKLM